MPRSTASLTCPQAVAIRRLWPVLRIDQRYSHVRSGPDHHLIRYEATDGSFSADIKVDDMGIVIDYPGIARRLGPTTSREG
jgi:hypothetical protein